jgi:xylan 1,4-beta-xylosidase
MPFPRKNFIDTVGVYGPAMTLVTYSNPVLPGFHPDPSVCRVGDDYYLVVSSFEYFPGLPLFHSRDLIHWRPLGHALDRPGMVVLDTAASSAGIFAPTLRHHDGRFYLITTEVNGIWNFVITASDPAGPWSDPVRIPIDGCIDPSLLFHEGRVWLTASASGQEGVLLAELDPATGRLLGPLQNIWRGTGGKYPEGPHLYVREGWFWLLISEGGTETGHMITLARSRNVEGPYEPCPHNPLLTHRSCDHILQSTGHGDLVEDVHGRWWMIFLATRPTGYHGAHHLGRETCLTPVDWPAGEWPRINQGQPLPLEIAIEPPAPVQPWPVAEESFLGHQWQFRRHPVAESCRREVDRLSLRCLAPNLDQAVPLAFYGRRLSHECFRASVVLGFFPGMDGPEAGLTVIMHERYHAEIAVVHRGGIRQVVLRQRFGRVLAELAVIPMPDPDPVTLELVGSPGLITFQVAGRELGAVETRHLSTELAGGFTGCYLGLYATGNGHDQPLWAEFTRFTYDPQ